MAGGSREVAWTAPCRICGHPAMSLVKPSDIEGQINSTQVKITDDSYGVTAAIYRCTRCGFMQCSEIEGVASAYQELEDPVYEAGRKERALQSRAILSRLLAVTGLGARKRRLLDIGAGSGILVEAATELGIDAEGIEPSRWLQSAATRQGCNVHLGTLPHPALIGKFDFVTMVDVIEHVDDPVGFVRAAAILLRGDGALLVVTPDAGSIAARMMGWHWWHYRAAHVGYFNRRNLELCLTKAGLTPIAFSRPGWVFSVEYLRERLLRYLPALLVPKHGNWMSRCSIPLNLRDSMMFIAVRDR
jgi:2-polyprenyl-3-methyl-5-hydroxy-6-metoxy-1,4-benzoquinol methylase